MFVLLGNCVTQSAYVGFGITWPHNDWQASTLRYVGFGRLDGITDYVLFFVPYFGIAITAAMKLHAHRASTGELGGAAVSDADAMYSATIVLRLTVASAAFAAVTVPSLPSLVYLLFVVAFCISELYRSRSGRLHKASEKLLNLPSSATMGCLCYTAIHFVAIYMYQLPELQKAARVSSAQFLGLYSMDKSEGPLSRLLRLGQILAVGGVFMGLCAVESHSNRRVSSVRGEENDDLRQPLIEGETSDFIAQNEEIKVTIVARLLARFGGILVGFSMLIASLFVVNIVAYPMLLLGLFLIVRPVKHAAFASIYGPLIFTYLTVWCVCEYVLLCIPPAMMSSMNDKLLLLLEIFGAIPAHNGEQSGINACYMGTLVASLCFVGWLTTHAKNTPTDEILEGNIQDGDIVEFFPLDDLELDHNTSYSTQNSMWDRPLVQLISHLLVPFALWIVALSKADLLHAALLVAFLFNIIKPGDRIILHLTGQILSGSIAVLYLWAMNEHLNVFDVDRPEWESTLRVLGLEHSSSIHTSGPLACILMVICIVLYLQKVLDALAPEQDVDAVMDGDGKLNALVALGKAIVLEVSLVCVKIVKRFGSYLVISVGLMTIETSQCSLINLALLMLLGVTLLVKRHSDDDRSSRRWRAILTFSLFNLAARYAFGAFPLDEIFLFTDDFKHFLQDTVGLAQNVPPNQLMTELLGPSILLVVTYFYQIGLVTNIEMPAARRSLPLAVTELGFFPLVKRFIILHANKAVALTAILFSIERRDVLGLLMLSALIAATLSLKTTEGPAEMVGTVALISAIIDYAYKIEWMQSRDSWSILTFIGAHKWPVPTANFWPDNEPMLRYPILVICAVELSKVTRFWLSKLPPALKSGCSPEPCHLFWPQRDTRAILMKRKASLVEQDTEMDEDQGDSASESSGYDSDPQIQDEREASSNGARRELTRRVKEKAQTNFGQISMLFSIAPELLEGLLANLMPGALYVAFAIVGIAATNILSLVYLGLTWSLLNTRIAKSPRDRLMLWRFTTGICALVVLWQYVVSIDIVRASIDGGIPPSSPSMRSLLVDVDPKAHLDSETRQWLAVLPCSKQMILGYFIAFFISACQLRMDAILASLEERARMTVDAAQADTTSLDDETVTELIMGMIPRQTPTQIALLPARTEEASYLDIIFAPLTWDASSMWTVLEWLRYFYLRYAVEWALLLVIIFGTCSRDLLHIGYLMLSFYFLRSRDSLVQDEGISFKILQFYNMCIIGAVLLYQAPLEGLLGDWYVSLDDDDCSVLHGIGFYKLHTVLGWGPGQLTADLTIFAILHTLKNIVSHPMYEQVLVMRRKSHDLEQACNDVLTHAWIRNTLARCLSALGEQDERHKRVEKVRNEITQLSQEVLALESRRDEPRRTNGDRKPQSETLRRRRPGVSDADIFIDENEDFVVHDENATYEDTGKSEEVSEQEDHEQRKHSRVVESEEESLSTLLQTWLMDQSSTIGLLFGASLKAWPWLTAPLHSMCYFFMILAFAIDFTGVTVVFPASIIAYALIAYPKASIGFWRAILFYTEVLLIGTYTLAIPCSLACTGWSACSLKSALFRIPESNVAFIPSMVGTFLAYIAILMHYNGQEDAIRESERMGNQREDLDGDILLTRPSSFTMLSRFRHLQFSELDDKFDWSQDARASPLHVQVQSTAVEEIEMFFQRMLTPEAEYGPSFVALSILSDKTDVPDWDLFTSDINQALVAHQMRVDGDNSTSFYTLEFVQADPKGVLENPGHRSAVFRVVSPVSIFCPGEEAGKALKMLQLRQAAGDSNESTPQLPDMTCVRAFNQEGQDFYTASLCFDILSTFFVAVFYQSSVDSDPEALVETYYQGLFKIDYVFTVFICLVLIVIDGVIYMKKAKTAKVFYHYLTFAGFMGYLLMIFHKPATTHHAYIQMFFLLKSISFTLSARQIRSGYPKEVMINSVIFQRSDILSFGAFMAYFSIPFMYELRVLLEYACTDSALDLYDWLKVENISRDLFRINVRNNTYRKLHPFGAPQPWWKKVFLEGGGLFLIIFSLLVGPFFVFSTSNPQVDINPVYDVRFNMSLVGAEHMFTYPIFDGGLRKTIQTVSWTALHTDAPRPLINKPGQVQEVCLAQDSDSLWTLPPPSVAAMKKSLANGATLNTGWTFKRYLPVDNPVLYSKAVTYTFNEEEAAALLRVLDGEQQNVFLENIYPRVWHLHGKGHPVPRYASDQSISCSVSLNNFNSTSPWWSVDCGTYVQRGRSVVDKRGELDWFKPCSNFENGPEIVLISSEVPTGVFATFSQFVGGLTGVYVVYILTLASIVRGFTNNLVVNIPHVDLPSTHRLISLCSDIYRARQVGDFILEERLYWLLIRIYRSPSVLFEFTRTVDGSALPERPKSRS